MHSRSLRTFCALTLLASFAGCGGASYETVAGKVTLDGAPLSGAWLSLSSKTPPPADADIAVKGPFLGQTDDQGQFSFGPVGNPGGGVPAGAYTLRITISKTDNEMVAPPPEKVPLPYSQGVDFEVPDGGNDAANFDLKSK